MSFNTNGNDGRICKKHPYGQHIALSCKNHPELRWSTKNIEYIGARSIFWLSMLGNECPCSPADLYHVCEATEEVPA